MSPSLTVESVTGTAIAEFDDAGPLGPDGPMPPVISSDTPALLTTNPAVADPSKPGRWTVALEGHGTGFARLMWEPMVHAGGLGVLAPGDDPDFPFQPPSPVSVAVGPGPDGTFILAVVS